MSSSHVRSSLFCSSSLFRFCALPCAVQLAGPLHISFLHIYPLSGLLLVFRTGYSPGPLSEQTLFIAQGRAVQNVAPRQNAIFK